MTKHSFDPHLTKGNCENFIGVAQVPIGFAGPITINGEHAKGDFLIPMATTEGTLVASYNRGIKVLNLSGGVRCTVVGDAMQRAPVFVFDDARAGREFVAWVAEFLPKIREEAEATSSVAKLQYIDPYQANKFVFLRFNYTTGDAAGQNMVGRATFAACSWILDNYAGIKHFYLESNFATDKKASQINIMRTRGKRVTAEVTVPRDVLIQHMRVEPESLVYHHGVANVGAFISGANNNGAHSANGITAMFIATGQDVANVAESSAAILYAELTPNRDMYLSITIPSLIVATHGGGTGLPTQSECLGVLGCRGQGQGEPAGRDHRRRGAGRRDFAGLGHLLLRLGIEPRALRPEPVGQAMRDLLADYRRMQEAGPVGRAVVTSVWGSAPQAEGATMLVGADGQMAGSVSGGCVEGAVAEEVRAAILRGSRRCVRYGVSHERAWEVGIACGGSLEVLVQPAVPPVGAGGGRGPGGIGGRDRARRAGGRARDGHRRIGGERHHRRSVGPPRRRCGRTLARALTLPVDGARGRRLPRSLSRARGAWSYSAASTSPPPWCRWRVWPAIAPSWPTAAPRS